LDVTCSFISFINAVKRSILTGFILILLSLTALGQIFHKGAVIECSEMTVTLHEGVTMDQYCHILNGEFAPATEKAFPGTTVFFARGRRGNAESKLGAIRVFESAEVRDRYFDGAGQYTKAGQEAIAALAQNIDHLNQIATSSRRIISNWVILNEPRAGLNLQKGGSFGLHQLTVTLENGVTLDQFTEFMINRYVPSYVDNFINLEVLIMKPLKDTADNQIAYVNYFETESSRDAVWPEPDTPSQGASVTLDKIKDMFFEMLELGVWTDDYGVWVMQ